MLVELRARMVERTARRAPPEEGGEAAGGISWSWTAADFVSTLLGAGGGLLVMQTNQGFDLKPIQALNHLVYLSP
nr:unnamed protein product [Digitaria exilis]